MGERSSSDFSNLVSFLEGALTKPPSLPYSQKQDERLSMVRIIPEKFVRSLILSLGICLFSSSWLSGQEVLLQKAKSYTGNESIIGWVMSEKLDGVRGYWNGIRLLTRKGLPLNPPLWFIQNFPPFELDGELWSRRGDFAFIQSVVLDTVPGEGWKQISYHIFEVPNQKGGFLSRLKKAEDWFSTHPNDHVKMIPQIPIREMSDFTRFFADVESKGGEGVMVKDPVAPYHTGRSSHMLKVKRARDMEGVVIGINPGKGKYESVMGSLTLELENGVVFHLGTGFTDQERGNPPPIGAVVTFKYHGFSNNGVPRFASFLRVRRD